MKLDVTTFIKTYLTCQKSRRAKKRKYGKLPSQEVTMTPWGNVSIDLKGPYTVTAS